MKTSHLLTLSILIAALPAIMPAAPKSFEGKVRILMTTGNKAVNMTQIIKGTMMRVETEIDPRQSMAMIVDMDKRETTMLMAENKMYMVMKMPEVTKAAQEHAQKSDMQVELTNETETILGHKCRKMIVRSKEGVTEAWGAEGIGTFMMGGSGPTGGRGGMMGRGAASSPAWESVLAEKGFYPLRLVTRNPAGKETLRMEAKEIDTSTPPDSAFLPPPDYQKFEMPVFPGMGGGAGQTDTPAAEGSKSRVPLLPNLNPFKKKSS